MKEINWKIIFEAMPLPCIVAKPIGLHNFVVLEVNQAYLDILGVSREDILSKNSREAFPPNPNQKNYGHDVLSVLFQKIIETGEKQVVENLRYDIFNKNIDRFEERYFSSQNMPLCNREDKIELVLHTIKETTENIKLQEKDRFNQEELDINRQQFRNFIKENPDGLFRLNLEGKFLHANKALADLAEMPVEDLIGHSTLPFCALHHADTIFKHFKKALAGQVTSLEADFISVSGQIVVLEIYLMPMFLDDKIAEIHGIAKDVTDIRKTEKIIVEKSRFLEVNAAFISSLLENEINNEALHEAFGVIANTIQADRMYYFGADKDSSSGEILLSQKIEWCSDKAESHLNNPNTQNIHISEIKEISDSLSNHLPYTATIDNIAPGRMKDIFIEQDIKSMLLLPIFLDKDLFGFIGFDDCSHSRIWKEEEISFLRSLTQNLTNAFEKRAALDKVRKREEELIQSEQKFRALVEQGSDLIAILDIDGYYSYVSENYVNILGLKTSELLGRNAYRFIHPDDIDRVKEQFLELNNQKQIKIPPFRFKDSSGGYCWIQTVATNLLNDSAVKGIVANSRDVTTIVEQAREIEQVNERYQLAATATQDLIYDWDLINDKVVRFHRSLDELYGYPSAEVNKKDFWRTYVHPEDLTTEKRNLARILANPNENFVKSRYRFRRADGSYAQVVDKSFIIRDSKGKAVRLIGATSDVSEIIAKKEALKFANKRFKLAMKASSEMIWDWDIKSDSVTRSKGYKSIFGYDKNDATSVHSFWLGKVAPEDKDQFTASLKCAVEDPNNNKWKLEYRLIKADGKIAYVSDRGYILRDENGKATRMVGAVLDVTNSRRLLRKIQKQNSLLKEIAWEQSHVVRAPLARMKGLLHLLEQEIFDEMEQEEVLAHMRNSADELDAIIKKIVQKTEEINVQIY